MKVHISSKIFYIFLILLVSISCFDIKYIPDSTYNATAAFAFLDGTQENKYVYFSFDFDYHNQMKKKQKNIAYFKINSDFNTSLVDIRYTIINKEWDKIDSKDIDEQRFWKMAMLVFGENNVYGSENYVRINKFRSHRSKNTAVLRITVPKKEGQITIENLYPLPEEILAKKQRKRKINFNSFPLWRRK